MENNYVMEDLKGMNSLLLIYSAVQREYIYKLVAIMRVLQGQTDAKVTPSRECQLCKTRQQQLRAVDLHTSGSIICKVNVCLA